MKPRIILWLFILLGSAGRAPAQVKPSITWGNISSHDFSLPKSKIIDSNTAAVIIADVGTINFVGNKYGWFNYVFKRRTRIKIIDKKAFDLGTIGIQLYKTEKYQEKLSDVQATTYNLENGQIKQTNLQQTEIYEDKLIEHFIKKKFTLPALKEGSIIEYTYTITSPFDFELPSWRFQNEQYPCLWSELNVEIPGILSYAVRRQGFNPFYINESSISMKNYLITDPNGHNDGYYSTGSQQTITTKTIVHHWVMKEVPALNLTPNESYVSSAKNYVDQIKFQLYEVYNGNKISDRIKDWKTAIEYLKHSPDFGLVLNEDYGWLSPRLAQITGDLKDQLQNAKDIYGYVRDHFVCNNYHQYYATKSLLRIANAGSGNVGEINMFLIALLRAKNINADPVLLSTRSNGKISPDYPILANLDYLICKATVGGINYWLDATRTLLPFGKLPVECYNGYARVISTSPDSVDLDANLIAEKKTTSVIIVNDEHGKQTGNFQSTPGFYESYSIREYLAKKTEKLFFNDIQTGYGSSIAIENTGIDSLRKLDLPIKIHYDFNVIERSKDDIFYFNPMLGGGYQINPFKASERLYPVEMPYALEDIYALNMEIPEGYEVAEMPKSVRVAYNETQGIFEYLIQKDVTAIQMRSRVKLNKAFFDPAEYNNLRNFFADIVKKQQEQIVFKKRK